MWFTSPIPWFLATVSGYCVCLANFFHRDSRPVSMPLGRSPHSPEYCRNPTSYVFSPYLLAPHAFSPVRAWQKAAAGADAKARLREGKLLKGFYDQPKINSNLPCASEMGSADGRRQ